MMTKDLLLQQMCNIETYKQTIEDYGMDIYEFLDVLDDLDKGLSEVYKLLCDNKLCY